MHHVRSLAPTIVMHFAHARLIPTPASSVRVLATAKKTLSHCKFLSKAYPRDTVNVRSNCAHGKLLLPPSTLVQSHFKKKQTKKLLLFGPKGLSSRPRVIPGQGEAAARCPGTSWLPGTWGAAGSKPGFKQLTLPLSLASDSSLYCIKTGRVEGRSPQSWTELRKTCLSPFPTPERQAVRRKVVGTERPPLPRPAWLHASLGEGGSQKPYPRPQPATPCRLAPTPALPPAPSLSFLVSGLVSRGDYAGTRYPFTADGMPA